MPEIMSSTPSLYAVAPPPVEQALPTPTEASHNWFKKALTVASVGLGIATPAFGFMGYVDIARIMGQVGLGTFVTRLLAGLLSGRKQKNEQ